MTLKSQQASFKPLDFDNSLLTCYLTLNQKHNLNKTPVSQRDIQKFVRICSSAEFAHSFSDMRQVTRAPIIALHAVLNEQISQEKFATIANIYSAFKQSTHPPTQSPSSVTTNPKTHSPFIQSVSADTAIQAIKIEHDSEEAHWYLKHFFCLSDTNVKKLIGEITTKTHSLKDEFEQHLWVIHLPEAAINASDSPFLQPSDPHPFCVVKPFAPLNQICAASSTSHLVVPSFTLLKCFIKTFFPDNLCKPQLAMGAFTLKHIMEQRQQGYRLIHVGIPGADNPEFVNQSYHGAYVVVVMNWYQWFRDSMVPEAYNHAIVRIDTLFNTSLQNTKLTYKMIERIYDIRWSILNNEIFTFKVIFNQRTEVPKFGTIFQDEKWTSDLIDMVLSDMCKNKEIWDKWGIDSSHLNDNEQKRYLEIFSSLSIERAVTSTWEDELL